jgi:alanyl-tRNA synthetase
MKFLKGAEIRQSYIDFFKEHEHTFVPSSSLVPGGDQTLLFTNAGMVQFKDVFLGTDIRPYTRAANSQKCMRVAGKHNDLEDVGRDNTHHTFFEMLGNWSFGDYYKKEAITWAWEYLTVVLGLNREKLWVSVFKDDKGEIPSDEEAAKYWAEQPEIIKEHILYFGRKDNFWEMADTGPCGPCSEIHLDLGPDACDKKGVEGHVCEVNGDCARFLELWNLVFMQYNRLDFETLISLPATHVDTGMGFERIVAAIQGVSSNYETDLFMPLIKKVQEMTGHTDEERIASITPYRVIADHARASSFLIADGVIPGNTGRNYVCRMIVRRASRFGTKIGLNEPFMARVAEVVIREYGDAYPELKRNEETILDLLTREEQQFQRTVEAGVSFLNEMLDNLDKEHKKILDGALAFDLYATHGLPFELTRDIAKERNLDVDEAGFKEAMEAHRLASGAGKAFGPLGGEDVDIYRDILKDLIESKKLEQSGVRNDPYHQLSLDGEVLALVQGSESVKTVEAGDEVEVILPATSFYIEKGGQVSDSGWITSLDGTSWKIKVDDVRQPAAGIIVHIGKVLQGTVKVGDTGRLSVDPDRRMDIMRNHTATHLLHAELQKILGKSARQAGSLVAPDRLRFDFTHPEGLTQDELQAIEAGVNAAIYKNFALSIEEQSFQNALEEGAMALFGEKYPEMVRTVKLGQETEFYSFELCGGTHVDETGMIGVFLITSESSAAAGIRRIEAVTGRKAYEIIQKRFDSLKETASILACSLDEVPGKTAAVLKNLDDTKKEFAKLRQGSVASEFIKALESPEEIGGIPVMAVVLDNADSDTLRQMTDRFRDRYESGVVVLGSALNEKPLLIASVTEDLTKRGLHAGNLIKVVAKVVGGGGGGRPTMAQAGGRDVSKLKEALDQVIPYVKANLK